MTTGRINQVSHALTPRRIASLWRKAKTNGVCLLAHSNSSLKEKERSIEFSLTRRGTHDRLRDRNWPMLNMCHKFLLRASVLKTETRISLRESKFTKCTNTNFNRCHVQPFSWLKPFQGGFVLSHFACPPTPDHHQKRKWHPKLAEANRVNFFACCM